MLQHNPELKSQIDQLWNKFWAGGISNPIDAIGQITYLLFMKRLDELEPDQKPFEVDKSTLRWSAFKRLQAEVMLTHVQTKVFPWLKDMNGARIRLHPSHEKCRVYHPQTVSAGGSGQNH